MASDLTFVDYILDQLSGAREVSARKMFGEYGVYSGDKMVAVICDNQFFLKPTAAGKMILGEVVEAPPYPGATNYFRLDDGLEDRELLSRLMAATADELPAPKPKRSKPKT